MTAPAPLDLTALLDDLERAHAAATPGPWAATSPRADGGAYIDPPRPRRTSDGVCWVGHTEAHADAEAIVAAVNAIGPLAQAVREFAELEAAYPLGSDVPVYRIGRILARLEATLAAVLSPESVTS